MRKSEILDQSPANESDDSEPQRAGIQSVEVGFELLNALSRASGALMLRDLAAAAGMSAAKAHRYLVSFQRLGLVTQDSASTRYDLGPAALRLGLASLSRIDAVRLARERIDALLPLTGHTLAIAVWGNQGPTMVHWTEAPQAVPVALRLGDVMPLLSSATGRCFAAFMGQGGGVDKAQPMIESELALVRKLGRTDLPSTQAQVRAILEETRHQGLGRVVNVLLPGISGFCAPVFNADGHLALGVVALGSSATLDTDWHGSVAKPLRAFAALLSSDLGWRPT